MRFFPAHINDARRQALDNAAFRWNQTGQQQKKLMKWGDRSQLQGGMLMLEAPANQQAAQKGRQAQLQPLPAGSLGTGTIANGSQSPGVASLIPGNIGKACNYTHMEPLKTCPSASRLLGLLWSCSIGWCYLL